MLKANEKDRTYMYSCTCDLTLHQLYSSLICWSAAVCHHTNSRPWRSARHRCMSRPLAAIVRRCRRRLSRLIPVLRPVKPCTLLLWPVRCLWVDQGRLLYNRCLTVALAWWWCL